MPAGKIGAAWNGTRGGYTCWPPEPASTRYAGPPARSPPACAPPQSRESSSSRGRSADSEAHIRPYLLCRRLQVPHQERRALARLPQHRRAAGGSFDWAAVMGETRHAHRNDTPWDGRPARTYKHYVISPDPDAVHLRRADGARARAPTEVHFSRSSARTGISKYRRIPVIKKPSEEGCNFGRGGWI